MTMTETRAEMRKRAEHIREHTAADAPAPRMLLAVHDVLALLDELDAKPDLTERQRKAMPEVVARAARHGVEVPADIHRWDRVEWQDESRPGRGHAVNAIHFYESSYFVQMLMDVYGYPSISVCTFEPVHSDADDECLCATCVEERGAEEPDFMDHTERMDLQLQNGEDR